MIRVGVNGYGTIGKRVADAVRLQPDMQLTGVAKTRPNYEAATALQNGYSLYSGLPERSHLFAEAGMELTGDVDDLIEESDVIVDATPSGIGAENAARYRAHDTPAILQGGEDADSADQSFVADATYEAAAGADLLRVVSCNTTGLSRLLGPLNREYGVKKVRATLVRRGGDPSQTDRGPINDILPDPVTVPSHHGPDVNTIFPELDIDTVGLTVPATLMHVHSVNITLDNVPTVSALYELFEQQSRIFLVPAEWRSMARPNSKRLPTTAAVPVETSGRTASGRSRLRNRGQRTVSVPVDPPRGRCHPRKYRCDPRTRRRVERCGEHGTDRPATRNRHAIAAQQCRCRCLANDSHCG